MKRRAYCEEESLQQELAAAYCDEESLQQELAAAYCKEESLQQELEATYCEETNFQQNELGAAYFLGQTRARELQLNIAQLCKHLFTQKSSQQPELLGKAFEKPINFRELLVNETEEHINIPKLDKESLAKPLAIPQLRVSSFTLPNLSLPCRVRVRSLTSTSLSLPSSIIPAHCMNCWALELAEHTDLLATFGNRELE